jgi:hypothetical protein
MKLCMAEEESFHVRRCDECLASDVWQKTPRPAAHDDGPLEENTAHTIIGLTAGPRYSNQGVSSLPSKV